MQYYAGYCGHCHQTEQKCVVSDIAKASDCSCPRLVLMP